MLTAASKERGGGVGTTLMKEGTGAELCYWTCVACQYKGAPRRSFVFLCSLSPTLGHCRWFLFLLSRGKKKRGKDDVDIKSTILVYMHVQKRNQKRSACCAHCNLWTALHSHPHAWETSHQSCSVATLVAWIELHITRDREREERNVLWNIESPPPPHSRRNGCRAITVAS